jgi:nickel-dependent lactate racemase
MKIKIFYDGAQEDVNFPDGAAVLEPKSPAILTDLSLRNKIIRAFDEYRDEFSGKTVTVVVNDATRRLPTSKILEILMELLPASSIEVLVATGTHRAPTDAELDYIFGPTRQALAKCIYSHDCRDENSLVHLGYTSRGTPVTVNRKLADAECLVCVNSVEPHFFAGFTGGRKSFVPGLAGFTTTVLNHSHAKFEEARSLNLESNPVHQDLIEAIGFIAHKSIFSIQLVTSREGNVVDLFCGGLESSFEHAVSCARDIYTVAIENKYDVVFAVGEAPLDINLYQLQKAQEHSAEAVADGGILIVTGACQEGVGSEYFVKQTENYPTPDSALSIKAMNDNDFGMHKLIKTARRLRKIKIWYVTKIDDKIIRKVYYEPKHSLQAALDDALALKGRNARVAILKDACFIVPVLL